MFNGSSGLIIMGLYYALCKGAVVLENLVIKIMMNWALMAVVCWMIKSKNDRF